jgi:hypothetical protein
MLIASSGQFGEDLVETLLALSDNCFLFDFDFLPIAYCSSETSNGA